MNKQFFSILGLWSLIRKFFIDHLKKLTAETLGWMAAIVLHCATIPSMLALLAGLNDKLPNVDIVLFIWTGLILLFARAILLKDVLNIVTIGVGFMAQSFVMAFVLFR